MGKSALVFILSHLAVSGFWVWGVVFKWEEHPIGMLPVAASVFLFVILTAWLVDHWE